MKLVYSDAVQDGSNMQVKDETDDKDAVQDGSNMQGKDETDDKDADQFNLGGLIV